jgi:hypothetical protein
MIRNYEDGSGNIILSDSTSVTVPVRVFTSSTTGGPIAGGVIGRTNAITTIAFCNTAAPSASDETTNAVVVNIYIVRSGKSFVAGNLIVSNLTVPAGETVFFSEERIVLDSGDSIWVGTSAASRLSVTVSALPV